MEKEKIWTILGIPETKEESEIKNAYRSRLVNVNPEDDEKGFMQLREAYEAAVNELRHSSEEKKEKKAEDEFDLWMKKAEAVYKDIRRRRDTAEWERLFEDEICKGLDTWESARERLLAFLADQFLLPQKVWIIIDREFRICQDKDALLRKFPQEFIQYCIRQISTDQYLDYDLFCVTSEEETDADAYIKKLFEVRREMDTGEPEELSQKLCGLSNGNLYHPYEDVERIRYCLKTEKVEELSKLIDKLSFYNADDYVSYYLGKAKWKLGLFQEAKEDWERILVKNPNSYVTRVALLDFYLEEGQYLKAREEVLKLFDSSPYDETLNLYLKKANENVILIDTEICKKNPENTQARFELAWCYYQNDLTEECFAALSELPENQKALPEYFKLMSYVFMKQQKFSDSLSYMMKWLDLIPTIEDEEQRNQDNVKANFLIGLNKCNLESFEEAIPYINRAMELETNQVSKLHMEERLVFCYFRLGENEKCIDQATRLLDEDATCIPALIYRQEAYDRLGNGQEVINDFYKIIELFTEYEGAYYLAAKVFNESGQYDNSLNIIQKAKEANINSISLRFLEAKNKKSMAEKRTEIDQLIGEFRQLTKELSEESTDNGTGLSSHVKVDEIYSELADAYAMIDEMVYAFDEIKEALIRAPGNERYLIQKLRIYIAMKRYQEALMIGDVLLETTDDKAQVFFYIADCYNKMNQQEKSIEYLDRVHSLNPSSVITLRRIAEAYKALYQSSQDVSFYEKAKPYVKKWRELIDNVDDYVEIGLFYESGYDLEESINCYRKAMELDPKNAYTHNNCGYNLKILRRMEEAIEELKKSIELLDNQKDHLPYSNLADCYEILWDYQEAQRCYDEILEFLQPDWVYSEKAKLFVKQGKIEEAVLWHTKRLGLKDAKITNIYCDIVECYVQANDRGNMKRYIAKAVKSKGKKVSNLKDIAESLMTAGEYKKAISYFKRSLELIQKNSEDYSECTELLAQTYFLMRKPVKAKKWAQKSLNAFMKKNKVVDLKTNYLSRRPYWLCVIGRKYLFLGETDKAITYFTDAVNSLPCRSCRTKQCHDGYFDLALAYRAKGDLQKAKDYLSIALKNKKDVLYQRVMNEITEEEKIGGQNDNRN